MSLEEAIALCVGRKLMNIIVEKYFGSRYNFGEWLKRQRNAGRLDSGTTGPADPLLDQRLAQV